MSTTVVKQQDKKKETLDKTNLGSRFNSNKPKWSLVPQSALIPMVRVLEYGAQKYTKKACLSKENILSLTQLWEKQEYAQIAIENSQSFLKDYVPNVTEKQQNLSGSVHDVIKKKESETGQKNFAQAVSKKSEMNLIQKHLVESKDIKESILIKKKINKKNEKEVLEEGKIQDILQKLNEVNFSEDLDLMESQKVFISLNVKKVVEFVGVQKDYTLIMIIKQGNLELYFAVNAIKDLDCLTTIFNVLKKLQIISQNTILQENEIIISGKGNWMKGLPVTEIYESLKRHLDSFMEGEDIDPESGLSHIGHICCNTLFLSWMMENKPELDDRFKKETV